MADEDAKRDAHGRWLDVPPRAIGKGHQFQKGKSGNPGGKLRRVKEAHALALEETPASFRLLIAQRDDSAEDSRVRFAAAKLLIAYGIGDPPKTVTVEDGRSLGALDELTAEELRSLARQSLAEEMAGPETDADVDDDDSDETEH